MASSLVMSLRESPALVWRGLKLVRRGGLRLPIAFASLDVISGALVGAELLLIRSITQKFLAEQSTVAVGGLVLFGVITAIRRILGVASGLLRVVAAERVEWSLVRDVISIAAAAPFERFEEPSFQDGLSRALSAARTQAFGTVSAVLRVTNAVVASASLVVVLLTVAPALLLPFAVAAVALLLAAVLQSRLQYRFAFVDTAADRERRYLREALTSRSEGKEARLFGSRQLLLDRHEVLQAERMRNLVATVKRQLATQMLGALTLAGALVFVFAVIAVRARDGNIDIADAAVAALTAQQLAGRLQATVAGLGALHQSAMFLTDLTGFIENPPPPEPASAPTAAQPQAIVLDDVSYTYPDTAHPAIDGISLRLAAGEVVAVVGENGAGKSTLAKVLAGLYRPTTGTVTVEDADGPRAVEGPLTGVVSAVFQDFARYELTVAENVWLGAPWRADDTAAVDDALARSGASAALGGLPDGVRSRLGRRFAGGVDLSIGQWQRLALARAFFSPAGFLVLDEPTASLDPRIEADLFDRLREVCAGRGVLLITHRYATVRSADRIIVLEGGRAVETGTHDDLMATGGLYAALYELQAARFR